MTIKTLAGYMEAAGLTGIPEWAPEVPLRFPPFPHQITGLNHLAAHVRSGLWDQPGTGKTYQIQACACWWAGMSNKVVAIMPPVLVPQFWKSFSTTFVGIERFVKIEKFEGDVKARNALIDRWEREGWPDVLVMSYRMFAGKSKKQTAKIERETTAADTLNWYTLVQKGYTAVFADESHALKHPSSQLYKAVKGFIGPDNDQSNGLVLATGTPVENVLTDAYGTISLLTPKRYGSYRAFERVHCIKSGGPFPKVIGYQNHEYLYQGLYSAGRRVIKKDVITDLPSRLITEIEVVLSKPHMDLYKRLVKEQILFLPDDKIIDATSAVALYQKMQQILLTPEAFGGEGIENAIYTSLDGLMEELGGRKLLLFAWYQESIKALLERYKDRNPAVLYGGVTGSKREEQKQKFIEDPTCQLMVAQPRSAGLGVDGFQDVCSYVGFVEICPIPGVFDQAIARLHRSGQQECVNIYLFVPVKTVAVRLRNALVTKDQESNSVLRDKRTLMADLMGSAGLQGELT